MAQTYKSPRRLALVLLLILALQSCEAEMSVPLAPDSSNIVQASVLVEQLLYLEEVIPPCVPVENSMIEPCPVGPPPQVSNVTVHSYNVLPDTLQTFTEYLVRSPAFIPHIVVRVTVLPGTSRCGIYPVVQPNYESDNPQLEEILYYDCFVEVRVNEYIVGTGPPLLTLSIYQDAMIGSIADEEVGLNKELDRAMQNAPSRVASAYDGQELVLFLSVSYTTVVESWVAANGGDRWFVQRDGDEVRVVSDLIHWARTDEHRRRLDMPLVELVREVKQAAEERMVITGGRIGQNSSLPLLVTDANRLQDFFGAVGAVYEGDGATVLPPPVPGGDEPAQDPTRVGEDPPGATSSVSVPGGGASPPPTDDASPTTAGTTIPASTTTTTAAVPQVEDSSPSASTTAAVPSGEETSPSAETTVAPSDGLRSSTAAALPPEGAPSPGEGVGAG